MVSIGKNEQIQSENISINKKNVPTGTLDGVFAELFTLADLKPNNVQTDVNIGKHCIVNTNCNIDQESTISDFTSICPGTTICGNVHIGKLTFIGANSTIIQGTTIGDNCIIGAGSVIIKNIEHNNKVVGNPGRVI